MISPAQDTVVAAVAAYRAEIEQLPDGERAPVIAHLDAAEQHLAAADRFVALYHARLEREAALADAQEGG